MECGSSSCDAGRRGEPAVIPDRVAGWAKSGPLEIVLGCRVPSLGCRQDSRDLLGRYPRERTVHQMRADALTTIRGIDSNEANGGGICILEVHGQISDRLTLSFDYDDMVGPPPTAFFDPHPVQLIAAFPIEMP